MMIRADTDGEVNLYHNGVKLNTKSDGVDITGELQCDSLDVDGSSNFESVATFLVATTLALTTTATSVVVTLVVFSSYRLDQQPLGL